MKKKTAKTIIARIFPAPKPYAVAILAAGQVVRLTITASTPERARLEAETIAEGGELLECAAAA